MRYVLLIILFFILSGCSSWSTTNVKNTEAEDEVTATKTTEAKDPSSILVTEEDITDRKYTILGDIEVTVRKTTIFNKDPTPEMVEDKLRLKAAEIGADAVILVRYGDVGVSLISWGALNGKGRAITFVE